MIRKLVCLGLIIMIFCNLSVVVSASSFMDKFSQNPSSDAYTEYEQISEEELNEILRKIADMYDGENTEQKHEQPKIEISFSDVLEDSWYYEVVSELSSKGIIKGYEDGTFKPNNNITQVEFLALLMRAVNVDTTTISGTEWYSGVLNVAIEKGVVLPVIDNEYVLNSITREYAAKYIHKSLLGIVGLNGSYNTEDIKKQINDVDLFYGNQFSQYIIYCYRKGVLVGDNNGNFNPKSNLTRAEAATIISRIMNDFNISVHNGIDNIVIKDDVAFEGRMRTDVATEYDLKALETARFYKENSKLYVSIDLPQLPKGFRWGLDITSYDKDGNYVYYNSDDDVNQVGKNVFEIVSKYDDKTVSSIVNTTLSVGVVNDSRKGMIMHRISTYSKNQVLCQSLVSSSDAEWVKFDTSKIFNW